MVSTWLENGDSQTMRKSIVDHINQDFTNIIKIKLMLGI